MQNPLFIDKVSALAQAQFILLEEVDCSDSEKNLARTYLSLHAEINKIRKHNYKLILALKGILTSAHFEPNTTYINEFHIHRKFLEAAKIAITFDNI